MSNQKTAAGGSVDRITHHYSVSVSFTKGGKCTLRLTQYIVDPRKLTTAVLGEWDAPYAGPVDAAIWLTEATRRWSVALTEELRRADGRQPELPLD